MYKIPKCCAGSLFFLKAQMILNRYALANTGPHDNYFIY
ncbi:hypothetical protein DESC_720180 [Desulfosarcina cetonica]|nr:hypothetical protein DESC_720180 [Desulfosarcina cetonica]